MLHSILLLSLLASSPTMNAHNGSDALIKQDFKNDASGWVGVGGAAKVTVTHQGPIAPVGLGALQFDYKIQKGEVDLLMLPTDLGSLAKAKSIKFKVRADSDAHLAVVLQEKDGGRYVAYCAANKNTWQNCELSPDDFILSQEATDPKDPDGKLDLDQVTQIAILDIGAFLGNTDNPDLGRLLHITNGDHTIFIERFSVESDPVPASFTKTEGVVSVDNLVHPQLDWLPIGDLKLSMASESPLTGPALKWDYAQAAGQFVGASLFVKPGSFSGAKTISFDLASAGPGTLRLQVEEIGGVKFYSSTDFEGGSKPKHFVMNFSDFGAGEDTSDRNAKLDLTKVKTLFLGDTSGPLGHGDPAHPDNTFYINRITVQ